MTPTQTMPTSVWGTKTQQYQQDFRFLASSLIPSIRILHWPEKRRDFSPPFSIQGSFSPKKRTMVFCQVILWNWTNNSPKLRLQSRGSKRVLNLNVLEMVGISSKHTLRFIRASNKNNALPRILKHFQVFFRSESKVLATKPIQPTSSPLPPKTKHLIDKEMKITNTMQRLFRFALLFDAKRNSEPKNYLKGWDGKYLGIYYKSSTWFKDIFWGIPQT